MASDLLIAVLAAGASRRLGRPKQLVWIADEPLLRRQCRVALEAQIGDVAVILGCEAIQCARVLSGLSVEIRINALWKEGLASSIRVAAELAISRKCLGLLLLHADQYRVTAQDLQSLSRTWATNRAGACRAISGGYSGPPVILPATMFAATLDLRGDRGARSLLASLEPEALGATEMPNAVFDLDAPDQLAELEGYS